MSSNNKPDLDLDKLRSAVNLGSVGNRYPNKKFAIICSEWNTEIINRLLDGDGMAGAMGVSICNFFQKDMVIRPQICGNASVSANIYGVNHSHWSIVYLGR